MGKGKGGQPTKLDHETAFAIIGALSVNARLRDAADAAGVSRRVVHLWLKNAREHPKRLMLGPYPGKHNDEGVEIIPKLPDGMTGSEFLRRVRKARGRGKLSLLAAVHKGAASDPKLALATLKAMWPGEFSERRYQPPPPPLLPPPPAGSDKAGPGAPASVKPFTFRIEVVGGAPEDLAPPGQTMADGGEPVEDDADADADDDP